MNRIAEKIKLVRNQKGLSVKQLAKKCGIAESYLADIESGKKVINESMIKRISGILGSDLYEPLYQDDEALQEENEPKVEVKANPNPEWQSAFTNIIKDIPVYTVNMDKAIGYKHLPVIDKKVEGYNPDKLIFLAMPDNTLSGFRIQKGDIIMTVLGSEVANGFYFVELDGSRSIKQLKLLGGGKVLIISNDSGIRADTRDLHEIKILGRCIRVEIELTK
jgi:Predicted transcription factor, homolog of eukaryotic MBF1